MSPLANPVTRVGIDDVNENIGNIDNVDPFAQTKDILDGLATQRRLRSTGSGPDLCDAVIPGNVIADTNHPALVVDLSPNGHNQGLEQVSNPIVAQFQTTYVTVLQANPARRRLVVQNTGTTGIYLIFGQASKFTQGLAQQFTIYHVKIASGATYVDELWRGRVDLVSDAANGVAAVSEYWRSTNFSQ